MALRAKLFRFHRNDSEQKKSERNFAAMGMEVNYEKDSKERIPFEHYLEEFRQADPEEIA